jgi:alkylation response protein AidB-like acyl-CoA dehydrogenase
MDLLISSARDVAIKEVLPTNIIGDREGCTYNEDGTVAIPEDFKQTYKFLSDEGWFTVSDTIEHGGGGYPHIAATVCNEVLVSANMALMMYAALTMGAARMIEKFGTDKQKNLFLDNMYAGHWLGTMVLTEPDAGSDVGSITATAKKNKDGTYSIKAEKIFISAGEHDIGQNIIHPVLARIEGAPEGTKGISLFIVPKIRIKKNGALGQPNDVVCTGIEEKLGIHGSATCQMSFGSKGKCKGFLLGEENKGMKVMFTMMNEARIAVGLQALSGVSAAYQYSLDYAQQRIQGKDLNEITDPNAKSCAIINHPDVQRMLMETKIYTEGARSLVYYMEYLNDLIKVSDNWKGKAKYSGMVEFLTPIVKGYVSDKAFYAINQGLQIHGGSGYTKEYPLEQLLRDVRIAPIYEGTNGIQAMDLLSRKLGLNNGQTAVDILTEIMAVTMEALEYEDFVDLINRQSEMLDDFVDFAMRLGLAAFDVKTRHTAFAYAYNFMEIVGDIVMYWMLMKRAVAAKKALDGGAKKKSDKLFYLGQIDSFKYFVNTVLPKTRANMQIVDSREDIFSRETFGK